MAFRCCFWLALNQSIISAAVDRWEGKREGEVGVLWFSLVRYRPTKLELFGVVRIYVDIGRNFLLAFFYVPFFFLFSSVEILFFFSHCCLYWWNFCDFYWGGIVGGGLYKTSVAPSAHKYKHDIDHWDKWALQFFTSDRCIQQWFAAYFHCLILFYFIFCFAFILFLFFAVIVNRKLMVLCKISFVFSLLNVYFSWIKTDIYIYHKDTFRQLLINRKTPTRHFIDVCPLCFG